MICFACNESLSDNQPWVILSRGIKKRECQGCHFGFDSEAVVQTRQSPLSRQSFPPKHLNPCLQHLRQRHQGKFQHPFPTAVPSASKPLPVVVLESSIAGRIVFASDRDGDSQLYVMNADGSGQTWLTDDDAFDWNPCWGYGGVTEGPTPTTSQQPYKP